MLSGQESCARARPFAQQKAAASSAAPAQAPDTADAHALHDVNHPSETTSHRPASSDSRACCDAPHSCWMLRHGAVQAVGGRRKQRSVRTGQRELARGNGYSDSAAFSLLKVNHLLSPSSQLCLSQHALLPLAATPVLPAVSWSCIPAAKRANMSLQARTKDLKFGRSPVHAWGLFARDTIPAEEFVIEYVGELIRSSLEDIREATYERSGLGSSYLFRVDKDQVVDATKRVCPSICNSTPVAAPVRTPLSLFKWSFVPWLVFREMKSTARTGVAAGLGVFAAPMPALCRVVWPGSSTTAATPTATPRSSLWKGRSTSSSTPSGGSCLMKNSSTTTM